MTDEAALQAEVDLLKGKIADTKTLYREVCALMFFRFGVTPTGNKLYQYVRRGSMSTPLEALAKFWEDLRQKAKVNIEHPGLPEELKTIAAEAMATIWRQATDHALQDTAAARLAMQADVDLARQAQEAAELRALQADEALGTLRKEIALLNASMAKLQAELADERMAHAGTQARAGQLQAQLDQARQDHQRLQEAFSSDLARAREDVEGAQSRAAAAERRALLEIEQERQARARADKRADTLQGKLTEQEARERHQAVEHAEAATRAQMQLEAKDSALRRALDAEQVLSHQVADARDQLHVAQQAAAISAAEVQTLKGLLAQLTPQAPSSIPPQRERRRKAAGP